MERKIGEIFEYNGEWYQTVEAPIDEHSCNGCQGCKGTGGSHIFGGECNGNARKDNKFVIFKKLEKVGDPHFIYDTIFKDGKVYVQNFMVYEDTKNHIPMCNDYVLYDWDKKIISIEIKQNKKEDMEEKKQCGDTRFRIIARAKEHLFQATNIAEDKKELEVLDSFLLRCWQMGWLKQYEDAEEKKLKPFDIEAAKAGKPVCTRDGRKARIVCFDRKDNTPIVALIECVNHAEILECVHNDGKCFHYDTSNNDLMMLPEEREGWILLRKDGCVFDNEEVAKKNCTDDYFVAKVEWEE